jgi:hypothetical protein
MDFIRPQPRRLAKRHARSLALILTIASFWLGGYPSALGDPTPPPPGFHTPTEDSTLYIEPFDYPVHLAGLPPEWEARKGIWGAPDPLELYYTIKRDGDSQYLSAETSDDAIDAGRAADVNLRIYNKLRWRWRAWSLPIGGNEEEKDKNDSGAAVRIIFKGGLRARMLKYVWSSTLPKGTETESAGNSKIKVIVLQSGTEQLGKWVWEEVNAYEDYKRLYGGEPRTVRILGIITDANNTKTLSKADYDDFTFLQIPTPEPNDDETQEESDE